MFNNFLLICLIALILSIVTAIYRVYKGPSITDRVMALDNIGINIIAMIAVLSMYFRTTAYLDIILLLGILSFVGTIAFARYIERGVVIKKNVNK